MTKPMNKRPRSDEWAFDMPGGNATHLPSGLVFVFRPLRAGEPPLQAGLLQVGRCRLPAGVPDKRQAGVIAPSDPNGAGVEGWDVLASERALEAAQGQLAAQHGGSATAMLARICREAGERWVFRARLERGWADGRRAS